MNRILGDRRVDTRAVRINNNSVDYGFRVPFRRPTRWKREGLVFVSIIEILFPVTKHSNFLLHRIRALFVQGRRAFAVRIRRRLS